MGKCENCVFWIFIAAGFQGACEKTATENGRRIGGSKASAVTSAESGKVAAILYTDADFGCTQFSGRKPS